MAVTSYGDDIWMTVALNREGRIVYVHRKGEDKPRTPQPCDKHKAHAHHKTIQVTFEKPDPKDPKSGSDPCCVTDPGTGEEVCWC